MILRSSATSTSTRSWLSGRPKAVTSTRSTSPFRTRTPPSRWPARLRAGGDGMALSAQRL